MDTIQNYKEIPKDKFNDILENYYKSGAEDLAKQISATMIKQGNIVICTPKDKEEFE